MLLQIEACTHTHTQGRGGGTDLCCGDYLLMCEDTKHNSGCYHLPADSPVLIQSGFAMLAIAKISAARNRHPEMIVSLSISLQLMKRWLNECGVKNVVVQMLTPPLFSFF